MLIIDGKEYDGIVIVDEISETFTLQSGNAAQTTQSGRKWYDIIGTAYGHNVTVRRNPAVPKNKWDEFWTMISAPVAYHSVTLEHNQSMITYDAHISRGSRTLLRREGAGKVWGDYTLTFEPVEPQRGA